MAPQKTVPLNVVVHPVALLSLEAVIHAGTKMDMEWARYFLPSLGFVYQNSISFPLELF